jgi:hypothetical protein
VDIRRGEDVLFRDMVDFKCSALDPFPSSALATQGWVGLTYASASKRQANVLWWMSY